MPTLTRWFIKTSFVCLGLGLIAGLLLGFQSILNLGGLSAIFPIYIHLLVFGWLTQLIFGVVYWMFPKFTIERPRRSDTLGWWTYGLLNSGLLLRAVAEPLQALRPNEVTGWMLVLSATLQFSAGLTFVINSWSRVKEK
jgi:hypothetical protein